MNYAAKIIKAGTKTGEWVIAPYITEVDGKDAAQRLAFSADSIKPAINDIVFCIESWTNSAFDFQQRINDPTGANVTIVGVFSQILTRDATLNILKNLNVTGKAALGAATKKMVLGENLQATIEAIIASLTALYVWGATGTGAGGSIPAFPGSPAVPAWNPANLSQNHKLD